MNISAILQSKFVAFTVIVILGVIVYSNTLNNGFVYDDPLVVEGNAFIISLKNLNHFFSEKYYLGSGETSWRPVVTLTYFIDYQLWEFNPAGYHLTNLIFHISNTVLLYFLIFYIISFLDCDTLKSGNYFFLSLVSALVFLLHPLQTEAVNSIGFRHEVVFTFFFFSSLLFYLKFRVRKNKKRFVFYGFSLICYFLSMASKEMAIVLPLLILVIEILHWIRVKKKRKGKEKKRKKYKLLSLKNLFIYFGFLSILGLYSFIRFFWLVKPDEKIRGLRHGVPFLGGTLYTCILTTLRIFVSYLKLFLFPYNLSSEHMVSISSSILEPRVLFALVVLGIIFILTIKAFKYSALFTLAGFWIFIPLITVSNIIPLHHSMAERYLYLSCGGFAIFVGTIFIKLFYYDTLSKRKKRVILSLVIVLLCLYSFRTFTRNDVWEGKASFWRTEILNSPPPHRARSYSALGLTYFREKKYKEAEKWFKKSLERRPFYTQAHNNLGLIYFKRGEYEKAIKEFKEVKKIDARFPQVYSNLCLSYLRKKKLDKALTNCKKAVDLNPNLAKAYSNLGQVYLARKNPDKAIEIFKKTLELNPHLARTYSNLAHAYLAKNKPHKAIENYKKALEINPYLLKSNLKLAMVYLNLEKYDKAVEEYKKVLKKRPNYAPAYFNIALVYYKKEKYKLAFKYAMKAEEKGYKLPSDFIKALLPHVNRKKLKQNMRSRDK